MATALHNLPIFPPISARKNKNLFKIKLKSSFKKTKRKSKPIALPRLTPTTRRAIFSFASSAFLPQPLNLLLNGGGGSNGGGGVPPGGGSGGDWWFGKRRGSKWDLDDILRLISISWFSSRIGCKRG